MQIVKSVAAFKELIKEIKNSPNYRDPLGFGISRIIKKDNKNKTENIIANWNENFASAAIFIRALSEQGLELNSNKSEAVYDININFLKSCLDAFAPHLDEAHGDKHRNIQTISKIYKELLKDDSKKYRVVFIFRDEELKTPEANSLKESISNKKSD